MLLLSWCQVPSRPARDYMCRKLSLVRLAFGFISASLVHSAYRFIALVSCGEGPKRKEAKGGPHASGASLRYSRTLNGRGSGRSQTLADQEAGKVHIGFYSILEQAITKEARVSQSTLRGGCRGPRGYNRESRKSCVGHSYIGMQTGPREGPRI